MKTVIFAGGFGTRISEETHLKPKPLIEIGGKPILWHIMKIYSSYEINDFVICCGYKGEMIKKYFSDYLLSKADVTLDVKQNKIEMQENRAEPWKITFVDTGLDTMTGGRLKRVKKYVENDTFFVSYGDDLKRVNMKDLLEFHQRKKTIATATVTQYPLRFGIVKIEDDKVINMKEKPSDGIWINGGYFVFEPKIFDYITGDSTVLEQEPLERLAKDGQLSAYKYSGSYQPMDTLKDKNSLEELWNSGNAYWKVW